MNDTVAGVRCLLLPLVSDNLLVPGATVVEILPFATVEPAEAGPDWYLGSVRWQRRRIPLLALDAVFGGARPEPGRRQRVAVLNTLAGDTDPGVFGILMQGIPRLIEVDESNTETLAEAPYAGAHKRVAAAGHEAVIPDIDAIEYLLRRYVRAAG